MSVAFTSFFVFLCSLTFAQELKPSVDFVSNSPVCQGQTIRLKASTTSLPAGTTVTYEWSDQWGGKWVGEEVSIPDAQYSKMYTVQAVFSGTYTGKITVVKRVDVHYLSVYAITNELEEFCPKQRRTLYSSVYSSDPTASVSYRWTGPNGFTSTLKEPVIDEMPDLPTATYRLTATLNGRCALEASEEVVFVQRSPRIEIGSGLPNGYGSTWAHNYCPGASFWLAAVTDYRWTDPPQAVLWTGPNGFRSTELHPVASGVGTYEVKARFAGCRDTVTASAEVRELAPDPVIRPFAKRQLPGDYEIDTLFCPGELLQLELTDTTHVHGVEWDFRWSGPNGFSAAGQRVTVGELTPAMDGVYKLTATYSGACSGTVVRTQYIGVTKPSVQILGETSFCEGDTLLLIPNETHDGIVGHTWRSPLKYNWTGPNGFASRERELLIPKGGSKSAGDYRLTVSYPAYCANAAISQTATVRLNPAAAAILPPDTTIQRGDSLKLAVRLTGGGPWRVVDWSGRAFETAGSPLWLTVRPDSTTQYTLRSVSGQCGPGTVSGPVKVTVLQPLGLTAPVLSLKAYPNPTADRLIIEWKIATGAVADLTLYDALGRPVFFSGARTGRGETETLEWSLTDLPPGRYYLRLHSGGRAVSSWAVLKQ
ncbi:T9SS type A sorting domain-containing protein [Tellurirhabdus rosea]|uniref:T9SS type A sorting domain-containing protein n=1 Tax=Tellurirhabdus rosea TaxID=2674997 RepID=UPI00225227F9|nr:T9SS type A sorting domain-containing protein [Tellurirhabdus rosea]